MTNNIEIKTATVQLVEAIYLYYTSPFLLSLSYGPGRSANWIYKYIRRMYILLSHLTRVCVYTIITVLEQRRDQCSINTKQLNFKKNTRL